jgi:hemerythrin-like metal-binding protein
MELIAMQWKECYSVGDLALDADHRLLIQFVDRIETARNTEESIEQLMSELVGYARDHFEREEVRMKVIDYSGLADQVREHTDFMKWLDRTLTAYHMEPDQRSGLADTVTEYLSSWLENHFLGTDMKYRDHLS